MANNRRVSIPIGRFQAGLALEYAIFIHLPRNQRFVKLIERGDSFDASQLARLTQSGISHLQVTWDPAKGDNPDAYQLFHTTESERSSAPEAVSSPEPQPTEAAPSPPATPIDTDSAEVESVALSAAEQPARLEAPEEPQPAETLIAAAPAEPEPEQRFSANKEAPAAETEQRFSASSEDPTSQHRISGKTDSEPEIEQRFSSSTEEKDDTQFRVAAHKEHAPKNRTVRSSPQTAEAEHVQKFSQNSAEEDDASFAVKASEQQDDNAQMAVARISDSRDFHVTLSRLAARLGHCLGYQNTNFLADLGITAVYHFSRKAGHQPDDSTAPELTRAILSASPDASVQAALLDTQDVLRFLDAYVGQPDCDHSDKDFAPKLLERVMSKLEGANEYPVDSWSLRKWATMLSTAETIDAHSTCTKASAKATKYVKSNLADEALPR